MFPPYSICRFFFFFCKGDGVIGLALEGIWGFYASCQCWLLSQHSWQSWCCQKAMPVSQHAQYQDPGTLSWSSLIISSISHTPVWERGIDCSRNTIKRAHNYWLERNILAHNSSHLCLPICCIIHATIAHPLKAKSPCKQCAWLCERIPWFKRLRETKLVIPTWISVVTLAPWWSVFSTHDFTTCSGRQWICIGMMPQ